MAKKSVVYRNIKRIKTAALQKEKRCMLKVLIKNKELSPNERWDAVQQLSMLSRDGANVRIRNRCSITGRPRGVYRKFMLSRGMLRALISQGHVPGVIKSSW